MLNFIKKNLHFLSFWLRPRPNRYGAPSIMLLIHLHIKILKSVFIKSKYIFWQDFLYWTVLGVMDKGIKLCHKKAEWHAQKKDSHSPLMDRSCPAPTVWPQFLPLSVSLSPFQPFWPSSSSATCSLCLFSDPRTYCFPSENALPLGIGLVAPSGLPPGSLLNALPDSGLPWPSQMTAVLIRFKLLSLIWTQVPGPGTRSVSFTDTETSCSTQWARTLKHLWKETTKLPKSDFCSPGEN